ncbi:MAG: Ig-like domain-containing protein, partial [Nitrososphaerota archaeon]|nr:Ig-like domain-containing protein [Nitrososphaerota archaeon]
HIIITPESATITAGDKQAYTATAYDQYDNSLGNVTGDTTFSITVGAGGSWAANVYTSQNAGNWTVTGTYEGKSDTASLTVIAEGLDHIIITPESATITAGDKQAYTATAYDKYNNSLGNVTGDTTFSITAGAGGSWAANVYTSQNAGNWTVTGTYEGKSGNVTLTVNAAGFNHIVITPDDTSITAGASQAYTATAYDQYNNGIGDVTGNTTFSISAGAGGNWTANTYTSEHAGNWTVTGTYEGKSDTASLTVNAAGLDHIVIAPKSATITAGASQAYMETAYDEYNNRIGDVTSGTTFSITAGAGGSWAANVYASQNAGTWTVTGTYIEMSDTATLTVAPAPPPPPPPPPPTLTSLVVTPGNASVLVGGTAQFTAKGYYSSGTSIDLTGLATWNSSNTGVAKVAAGQASGVAIGSAEISATFGGLDDSATLNVVTSYPVMSIVVTPQSASIAVGQSQQFMATATYENGSTADVTGEAIWASGNTSVATVSAGNSTGVGVGTADITASLGTVTSEPAILNVGPAIATSVTVTPEGGSVKVGGTQQLTATAKYSDGSTADVTNQVTWSSSDESIAGIDAGGLATGKAVGNIEVTATLGTVSGSATLTVYSPTLLSIVVTPNSASIVVNGTQQFTATGVYSDNSSVDITASATWASSDTGIATIDGGLATGKGVGSTDIGASLGNVTSNTASLSVTAAVPWWMIGGIIGGLLALGLILFFLLRRRRREEPETT